MSNMQELGHGLIWYMQSIDAEYDGGLGRPCSIFRFSSTESTGAEFYRLKDTLPYVRINYGYWCRCRRTVQVLRGVW